MHPHLGQGAVAGILFVLRAGRTVWSGRKELNLRLLPWTGGALPLSYVRGSFN